MYIYSQYFGSHLLGLQNLSDSLANLKLTGNITLGNITLGQAMLGQAMLGQAEGAGGGSPLPGACGGGMANMLPIIFMFGVFYMLVLRPQQQKMKQHREMLNNLQRGDQIITRGGIIGEITLIDDNHASISIANNISIKLLRSAIAGKADAEKAAMSVIEGNA